MLCASVSFFVSAQTPTLTVLSREGRKPIPMTTVNNQEYLAVDDVNAAFGTTSREDRLAGGLTITARGQSIMLTENQNVVSVAGRLASLPLPVLRRDNRWLVPVDFLTRALSSALATRIDYRRGVRLLIVGEMRVPRVVARIDAGTTNVALTFEITPNTEAKVSPQQGRLIVQFDADALELSIPLLPQQEFLTSVAAWRYAEHGCVHAGTALRHASRDHDASRRGIGTIDHRFAAGHDRDDADACAARPHQTRAS